MKIQINEVWNDAGRSEILTVIEAPKEIAQTAIFVWVSKNRPDLSLANSIYSHGFHAVEVRS